MDRFELVIVGAPEHQVSLGAFPLILGRRSLAGSVIGGIKVSTGSLRGPVTVSFRREPPRAGTSASRVPSPPSASGSDTISSNPARRNPSAIAAAASPALSVPLNLSGHTRAESITR